MDSSVVTLLPPGYSMRLADLTDRNSVLRLSHAEYHVVDYIPMLYNQWVRRENTFVYLLEHKGQVIGFEAIEVNVEDGYLIMLESCVDKAVRGRRLYLPFHLSVLEEIRRRFRGVTHFVGTSIHVGFFESRRSTFNIVNKWKSMQFEANFQGLSDVSSTVGPTRLLAADQAVTLLQHPLVVDRLFSGGFVAMFVDGYPLKTTKRNMKRLAEENHMVVTLGREGQGQGQGQVQGHEKVQAVSIGQLELLNGGEEYCIYFHGDDLSLIRAHVEQHLYIFRKIRNPANSAFIDLNFSARFEFGAVKAEVKPLIGQFFWEGVTVTNYTQLDPYIKVKKQSLLSKL